MFKAPVYQIIIIIIYHHHHHHHHAHHITPCLRHVQKHAEKGSARKARPCVQPKMYVPETAGACAQGLTSVVDGDEDDKILHRKIKGARARRARSKRRPPWRFPFPGHVHAYMYSYRHGSSSSNATKNHHDDDIDTTTHRPRL